MYRTLQQARVLTLGALARIGSPVAPRATSMAKIKASEGILALLRIAHQVHGGVGFYRNYPLERLTRQALVAAGAAGSALWHRRLLSDLLGTDPGAFVRPDAHQNRFFVGDSTNSDKQNSADSLSLIG
jgi:alkylation response protein AidB-like acyl-CoA dehydrogenase